VGSQLGGSQGVEERTSREQSDSYTEGQCDTESEIIVQSRVFFIE
jgi:hypothetical protein